VAVALSWLLIDTVTLLDTIASFVFLRDFRGFESCPRFPPFQELHGSGHRRFDMDTEPLHFLHIQELSTVFITASGPELLSQYAACMASANRLSAADSVETAAATGIGSSAIAH
jgi:hypothetical protein